MLGTFLVFCVSLWAILWYLTYDDNRDSPSNHETGKQEQHQALGRKRNRKKHGEKRGTVLEYFLEIREQVVSIAFYSTCDLERHLLVMLRCGSSTSPVTARKLRVSP